VKYVLIAIIILFAVASASWAQNRCKPNRHTRIPAIAALTYHKARKKLLAAGWQPVRTIHYNEVKTNPNILYGNGQEFWKRGYYEIELCSGTGLAPCTFVFQDVYGNQLRVATTGEELFNPRAYARVSSFRFICD
jgi:hypothetical protein